jgi:hypothetical protein|tara:strand:- start:488 stop:901 length:414 start_codon:yes stop_codon:yes gene_type:complete
MILQFIIDMYVYIITSLFPQNESDGGKKVRFEKNNYVVESTARIEPMDRSLENYEDKSYIQQFGQPFADLDNVGKSNKSLAKIHSWCPDAYYCGYCSKYIPLPVHLYLDKVYCTISCRSKQYDLDRSSQVRQTHSFS